MEVHFTLELQAKFESVAAENRRGADEYVQQLVENYLDHDSWQARPWRALLTRKLGSGSKRSSSRRCGFAGPGTLRQTSKASLTELVDYIRRDNPSVAQRVGREIYERLSALGNFPYSGRLGRVEGTRELPLPSLPYIVIYRVLDRASAVEIVNVIHGGVAVATNGGSAVAETGVRNRRETRNAVWTPSIAAHLS